jgi:hypothetical protein
MVVAVAVFAVVSGILLLLIADQRSRAGI